MAFPNTSVNSYTPCPIIGIPRARHGDHCRLTNIRSWCYPDPSNSSIGRCECNGDIGINEGGGSIFDPARDCSAIPSTGYLKLVLHAGINMPALALGIGFGIALLWKVYRLSSCGENMDLRAAIICNIMGSSALFAYASTPLTAIVRKKDDVEATVRLVSVAIFAVAELLVMMAPATSWVAIAANARALRVSSPRSLVRRTRCFIGSLTLISLISAVVLQAIGYYTLQLFYAAFASGIICVLYAFGLVRLHRVLQEDRGFCPTFCGCVGISDNVTLNLVFLAGRRVLYFGVLFLCGIILHGLVFLLPQQDERSDAGSSAKWVAQFLWLLGSCGMNVSVLAYIRAGIEFALSRSRRDNTAVSGLSATSNTDVSTGSSKNRTWSMRSFGRHSQRRNSLWLDAGVTQKADTRSASDAVRPSPKVVPAPRRTSAPEAFQNPVGPTVGSIDSLVDSYSK